MSKTTTSKLNTNASGYVDQPTEQPAYQPTEQPAYQPTEQLAHQPTERPPFQPTEQSEQPAEQPADDSDDGVSIVRNITTKSFGKIKKGDIPEEGSKKIGTIIGVIDSIKEVPNAFNTEETQLKLLGVFSAISNFGHAIEEATSCFLPSIGEDAIRAAMASDGFKLPLEFAMAVYIAASSKSTVGYTYIIKPLHQSKPPSRLKELLQLAHTKA